jgi:hypothetical protein
MSNFMNSSPVSAELFLADRYKEAKLLFTVLRRRLKMTKQTIMYNHYYGEKAISSECSELCL